jgi:hypothetical protein
MPKKKYIVALSDAEREELEQLLRGGKHASRKLTRARILLKAAAGCRDEEIVAALGVGRVTRPGKTPKLDPKGEARLIAEACSEAPEGRARWTLQLLSDRVVALGLTDSYTAESVRQVLKKTNSSRG